MELDLPVPQEDKSTGKVVEPEEAGNKVFQLPELSQFLQDTKSKDPTRSEQPADLIVPANTPKVNRRNVDEYQQFLRNNPFADSDERYFTKEVKKYSFQRLSILLVYFVFSNSLISFHQSLGQGSFLGSVFHIYKQGISSFYLLHWFLLSFILLETR